MISLAPDPEHHHCTHPFGRMKKSLHGPWAPDGTMPGAVWVCCHCGRLTDINAVVVNPKDVIADAVKA